MEDGIVVKIPVNCDAENRLRRIPLEELKAFQGELKTLGQAAHNKLRDSMLSNGFIAPVYIWTDGNRILDGHQRVKVLTEEQIEVEGGIPVVDIYAANEKDAAEKLLVISSAYGKVEPAGLYDFTTAHGVTIGADSLDDLPDFNKDEYLAEFYKDEHPGDPDEVPEAPDDPVSQRGDLYVLGDHRLLCGDSGDAEDMQRLMAGKRADFVFTSPPYNVGVSYDTHDDKEATWEDYSEFLTRCLQATIQAMDEGRAIAWNIGSSPKTHPHRQMMLMEELGMIYARCLVWQKVGVPVPLWYNTTNNAVARNFYPNYTHELVLLFSKGLMAKGSKVNPSPLLEHDVFQLHQTLATVDLPEGNQRTGARSNLDRRSKKAHPAAFPVQLPTAFIDCLADMEAIVLDPFGGAGSTMMAAEKTGRACYAMELSPAYVDVSVQRWEAYTGKVATLEDGTPYSDLQICRSAP